jgi:hypothetical protein
LKEIERILEEKFPRWRMEPTIDRFIRRGYLSEDENGIVYIGWRARAEVDQKTLLGLLLGKEGAEKSGGQKTEPKTPEEEG